MRPAKVLKDLDTSLALLLFVTFAHTTSTVVVCIYFHVVVVVVIVVDSSFSSKRNGVQNNKVYSAFCQKSRLQLCRRK